MRPNGYTPTLLVLLALAPAAQAQYGSGIIQQVPMATGAITLDGDDNEADWANAPEVDLTANWDPYGIPAPDIVATGKLLWSNGALYVHVFFQDYQEFYWGQPGNPWQGEQVLVGVDLTHAGDDQMDDSFGGWTFNMPDAGPVAYKVSNVGITANWGYDGVSPVDSGWVAGTVFVDDASFSWGVEMAIYGDEVAMGNEIGFNIGGAAASLEWAEGNADSTGTPGEGTYGYFAWQVCPDPGPESFCHFPGGNVMSDAGSFATLSLVESVANEGGPDAAGFSLRPNVPNPFQGTTALTYELPRAGEVELAAYDVLGRRVAVLDAGVRAAGEHRAVLDAALPSGVYTVRLAVDGAVVATRRVMRAD